MELNNQIPEGVDKVAQTISTYGVTAVLVAVILLLLFGTIIAIVILNKKQTKTIETILTKLVTAVVDGTKDQENEPHHKELVKEYMETQILFENASKMTLEKLDADRVAIYVFHNGNESNYGFPFYKMSCVGEWVHKSYDMNCKVKDHMNMPLYPFNEIIKSLYNSGHFENITNIDNASAEMIVFTGTPEKERVYMLGLYDSNNNLAGFTLVKFKTTPKVSIDTINAQMVELNNLVGHLVIRTKIQKKLSSESNNSRK